MTRPVVLVMAKAPVPGQVKTRLAVTEGDERAASLAAAALLDTLDVCEQEFAPAERFLAVTGELAAASSGEELLRRLGSWAVLHQRGEDFAARLANAHRDVHERCGGPVVQIGMDTPHVAAEQLRSVGRAAAREHRPVLGLAEDGGWWVLVSAGPHDLAGLDTVPMSTEQTGELTLKTLGERGVTLSAEVLRDVDDASDAAHVAALAPHTRFARIWNAGTGGSR